MKLSIEEMMILSEKLEKEQARYRQLNSKELDVEKKGHLKVMSQLQKKLKDGQADLSNQEQAFLSNILKDELNHIHGHGTGIYESIIHKCKR